MNAHFLAALVRHESGFLGSCAWQDAGNPIPCPASPLMGWSFLYVGDLRHVLPSVVGSLQGEWGLRKRLGVYGEFGVYGIASVPRGVAENEPLVTYQSMSPRKRIR